MNIIQNGRPNLRGKIPLSILPYWNIRDEFFGNTWNHFERQPHCRVDERKCIKEYVLVIRASKNQSKELEMLSTGLKWASKLLKRYQNVICVLNAERRIQRSLWYLSEYHTLGGGCNRSIYPGICQAARHEECNRHYVQQVNILSTWNSCRGRERLWATILF